MTESAKTEIVIPGSITDIAKALREIIGALRDVGSLVKDGAQLFDKKHAKNAATNLYTLAFAPHGSRQYLERIAEGKGTADDLKAIGQQMADTAAEVEISIQALTRFEQRLRETFGMESAYKLDRVINGPSGKQMLRHSLIEMAKAPNVESVQARAKEALAIIDELNQQITDLHDMILSVGRH